MAVEHVTEAVHHGSSGIHVALSAERLGEFLGIPITNTLITTWVVMAVLIAIAFLTRNRLQFIPNRTQALLEWMFEFVYDYVIETLGSREMARRFFPLLMTIFIFVLFLNWFEFLPGVGSITFDGHPLFRGANTDLTVPLVLAIMSFLVIEITGIMAIGVWKYGGKFLQNPLRSPIGFVIGIIELIGEMVRVVSLSFRLFGNILAGAVIISVATFFAPYGAPGLLMLFELFIGLLQAAIFALLTLFFIKLAIEEPHGEGAH
ncbi:ATP synthase F0 subunit A [Candidatus Kaiserbacteria bacterium RIFCSPLOWO2_01_FULL_53_17]|uniref:ATP synthase subunit a n=1 Tax=Candidatus Kaiserbacteria bacterium RIFCSPLOWO2_01_FULL_53_17 TaxID=1798511 RepID=A0A1F6EGC1_9BACT|nr:MAG: ATP synthase F0 subunit A [Candidatus Kaiserbacteria bacterium RIFCSPLOWO2_01_FULL_53_17]